MKIIQPEGKLNELKYQERVEHYIDFAEQRFEKYCQAKSSAIRVFDLLHPIQTKKTTRATNIDFIRGGFSVLGRFFLTTLRVVGGADEVGINILEIHLIIHNPNGKQSNHNRTTIRVE